jgi:hypothetical protein
MDPEPPSNRGAWSPPGSQPQYPDWPSAPPPRTQPNDPRPGHGLEGPIPVQQRPPVDGFAITSLITGLLGGVLLSVGFGIAALRRIRRGKRRGRGLAIAGLSLSLAWTMVYGVVIAYRLGREPARNTTGAVTREGQIAPADLRTGDCVQVPRVLSGTYTTVTVVPCAQPHNGQVFTTLQAREGPYPGDAALQSMALDDCKAAEVSFLGTNQTLLHVVAYFPPEQGWSLGRRDEHCLLVDRAKDITGDIRSDK